MLEDGTEVILSVDPSELSVSSCDALVNSGAMVTFDTSMEFVVVTSAGRRSVVWPSVLVDESVLAKATVAISVIASEVSGRTVVPISMLEPPKGLVVDVNSSVSPAVDDSSPSVDPSGYLELEVDSELETSSSMEGYVVMTTAAVLLDPSPEPLFSSSVTELSVTSCDTLVTSVLKLDPPTATVDDSSTVG